MALNINGTTGISGVDGSASAPALQGSDSNTGVSFGADTVNINTGGTTKASIDSSGALDVPADFPIKIGGSEKLKLDSNGRILAGNYFVSKQIGQRTSSLQIQGTDANTSSLSLFRYSANDGGSAITLGKGRSSSAGGVDKLLENDTVGSILWVAANNADLQNGNMAAIDVQADAEQGGADTPARMRFLTAPDNSSTLQERMRIDSDGKVMINTTSNDLGGVTGNLNIANTNTNNHTVINCSRNTASNRNQIRFLNPNGNVGSVTTSGTSSSFNTASDYRLKENEVAISDGITRLKQLKPYKFNFKTDSSTILDGFFAHEVSSIVPEAITGTKDAVVTQAMIDAGDFVEGTLNDPIHQQIDQAKLVPLLTAALQEAVAKIEILETKVAALEAG